MKKTILLLSILTLTSCVSIFLNTALEKVGVFDKKVDLKMVSNNQKNLVFIGMHHIGRKEFYNDVSHKVDSLQHKGYVVFYELTKKNSEIDSLTNDVYKKKIRKILGLNTSKYYDTINNTIGGKYKYKGDYKLINQPKYPELNVNMDNAKNADVETKKIIDEFEIKYGEVILNECDKKTKTNLSEYKCDKIDKELTNKFTKEFVIDFRNANLANDIYNSKETNILVIYGKNHFNGLITELQKIDANWKKTIANNVYN